MPISFGRGGSGGAGGSSRVGFAQAHQSTDLQVTNHASNFTDGNFTTPSFLLSLKDSGRGSILFGSTIQTTYASEAHTGDIEYEAKLQVSSSASETSGFTTWDNLDFLHSNGVVYQETESFDTSTTVSHYFSGEVPFNLSQLPDTATNGRYLRFRMQIRVRATGEASNGNSINVQGIAGKEGFLAFKAFGVGASSTDIPGGEIANASITNAQMANNSIGTNQLQNGSVTTPKIADLNVTRGKLAADAVDDTKLADNSVGSEHIKAGAVGASEINNATTWPGSLASGSVGNSQVANDAITTAKIQNGQVTHDKLDTDAVENDNIKNDAVDGDKIKDDSISPAHINVSGSAGNKVLGYNSDGSAFELKDQSSGGGGGISSVGVDNLDGVTGGSADRGKFVKTDATTADEFELQTTITPGDIGISSPTAGHVIKINSGANGFTSEALSGGGGLTSVGPDDLDGISSTDTQQFIKTNFDGSAFTHQSVMGPADLNVGETGDRDRFVKVKSDGTGFETSTAGSGSLSSVGVDDLDGVSGGASDRGKFVKTDSTTNNEFEVKTSITPGDMGFTEGTGIGDRFIKTNTAGTAFISTSSGGGGGSGLTSVNPGNLDGIDGDSADGNKLIRINSGATEFETVTTVGLSEGGTGYSASDLNALRNRLGITNGGGTDPQLVRSTDADTQHDNTIHYFDSNTSNRPTGATNGIIVRQGNDQWLLNADDGKTWKRDISNTGTGTWSTPVAATITGGSPDLKRLQTESDFRTFAETDQGWSDTDAWLPAYNDGNKPDKVIVGRNGNYLVAIDRNNMWWTPRPVVNTWAEIPWRWEGLGNIPKGLQYTGGETDEYLIPAGEDAVISGKTGIPGENFISLLVDHSVASGTSTFTGFYVDDDASKTLRKTTQTRGNTVGTWGRNQLDQAGIANSAIGTNQIADEAVNASKIDDDIIVEDAGSSDPVFLGIVPAISDLTFTGYTYKTSLTNFPQGGAYFDSSSRTMYVRHKDADVHLQDLFAIDYEVSIQVSDTHYVRGVFDSIQTFNLPGVGQLTGGVFRAADLQQVGGVIANDTTVSILGHKAVLTKTDTIGTVNLANNSVTQSKINAGAVDTDELADGAVETDKIGDNEVTAAKIAGVSLSGNANKVIAVNTSENALEMVDQSGGLTTVAPSNLTGVTGGATDQNKFIQINSNGTQFSPISSISGSNLTALSVDTGQIAADAIDGTKIEDNAIDSEHITADAIDPGHINVSGSPGGKVLGYNDAGTAFELKDAGGGGSSGTSKTKVEDFSSTSTTIAALNTDYALPTVTPAWQIKNRSTDTLTFIFQNQHSFSNNIGTQYSSGYSIIIKLQSRHADTANGTYSSWDNVRSYFNENSDIVLVIPGEKLTTNGYGRLSNNVFTIPLSNLPSGATDNKYVQFRAQARVSLPDGTWFNGNLISRSYLGFIVPEVAGGSGGGSSTPADGSITTAKLAADSVTNAKLADDAVTLGDKIKSVYTSSADFTYTGYNQLTVADGQISYVANGNNAQIYADFTTADVASKNAIRATSHNGNTVVLYKDADTYVEVEQTQSRELNNIVVIDGVIVSEAGTLSSSDTVQLLFGATGGLVKTKEDGDLTTGYLEPRDIGLNADSSEANKVVTIDDDGTGFDVQSAYLLPQSVKPAISKSREYTVVTGSTADGEYAQNSGVPTFGTTDNGADATFLTNLDTAARAGDGTTILIVKDSSNYISFRSTGAITQGSNLSLFSNTSNYSTVGTISNGDKVRVWLEPANANQIIQFGPTGESANLIDLPSGGADGGAIRQTLMMKQEITGSNEISVSSSNGNNTRAALQTQTGTWTVANKSTDWLRMSGGGLCYFGNITAQPICVDVAVLVRWANGTDTFQTWNVGNSRVDQIDLGSDRLMVVKLFAGGAISATGSNPVTNVSFAQSHVDCAVGSGYKFIKLSQLPSGIVDGSRVQFTIAFAFQSPSATYTARRWFLTAEVLDGSKVSANF